MHYTSRFYLLTMPAIIAIVLKALIAGGCELLNFGINKARNAFADNFSERTTFYDMIITESRRLAKAVDNLTNEPLQTALIHLELGLRSTTQEDFKICEQSAIKAFGLSTSVKSKVESLCIAIIAICHNSYDKERRLQRIRVLHDVLLRDKYIIDLFTYISDNRFTKLSEAAHLATTIFAQIASSTFILIPVILYINRFVPLYASVSTNFRVDWHEKYSYEKNDHMRMIGVTNNSCHVKGCLMLIGMNKEVEDLQCVNDFLKICHMMFQERSVITLLSTTDNMTWKLDNVNESLLEDNRSNIQQCFYYFCINGNKKN